MKKIVSDFSTQLELTADEAKNICKLGQGEKCCAFLVMAPSGFECIRMYYPTSAVIFDRLNKGTMNAQGRGMWPECFWSDEHKVN